MKYRILPQTKTISGKRHTLIEREDGFRFYLDDAFMCALKHSRDTGLEDLLREFGTKDDEIPYVLKILQMAELEEGE